MPVIYLKDELTGSSTSFGSDSLEDLYRFALDWYSLEYPIDYNLEFE